MLFSYYTYFCLSFPECRSAVTCLFYISVLVGRFSLWRGTQQEKGWQCFSKVSSFTLSNLIIPVDKCNVFSVFFFLHFSLFLEGIFFKVNLLLMYFFFFFWLRRSKGRWPAGNHSHVQDESQSYFWTTTMVCPLFEVFFQFLICLFSAHHCSVYLLSGFVQGEPGAEPRFMQFHPNFQHGALLTVVSPK